MRSNSRRATPPPLLPAILVLLAPAIGLAKPHCSDTLPPAVAKLVHERFSDGHIVSKKDRKIGCPGIARVDFYGDGRTVLAISIKTGDDGQLLLAEKDGSGWKLSPLQSARGASMAVWFGKAGKYESVYGEKSFTSKGDVILYFDGESATIAYGWTGAAIEKVWTSD
ncbi:MAG: hypothetical protein ABR567_19560 [Myxococcales bacterium]|nr:hypothetical protein [Myxococcales bacterium]